MTTTNLTARTSAIFNIANLMVIEEEADYLVQLDLAYTGETSFERINALRSAEASLLDALRTFSPASPADTRKWVIAEAEALGLNLDIVLR